ncbi:MAG: DNA mismatch repair endonuclease MutL [Ruminococcaceae bacterium]|nr:DNA mismatch repair endonuclease MutL [Oscillospiraceae bacterium]
MGIINQLDYETANLVAAGEVIDRPASIVKELIENSIDAGATKITVEIKKGGVSFIRVTDNGKGMAREDVPLSIKRHATSKIKNGDDLNAIFTLGFRGEALAAIAAVAKVRIRTKRPEDAMGTEMYCEPGIDPTIFEMGMADGTTIIVEDLFEKIPARRKFLKKDQTEANAVQAVFERIAMSQPDIAMEFIVDNWQKIRKQGYGRIDHGIHQVMGIDFGKSLIPIVETDPRIADLPVRVSGFIGTPNNVRSNRNYQFFFVNGRYVKSKCMMAALEQGYHSYIPDEKHPACVVFLELPPTEVDVNVHPTKLEVRFAAEKMVFEAVYFAVKGTLEQKIPLPELQLKQRDDPLNAFLPIDDRADEPPEPPRTYNNQRNVKRGQLSYADMAGNLTEPVAIDAPIPITPPEPPTKPGERVYEARPVESPKDIPERIVQTNYWEEIPPVLNALMTARHNGKTIYPLPQQMVLDELPPEIDALGPAPKRGEKAYSPVPPPYTPSSERLPDVPDMPVRTGKNEPASAAKTPPPFRIIGEAFLSYVFVEVENRVMIIDKHAAHERIIFEDLKANRRTTAVSRQMMLVPLSVALTPEEMAALGDYKKDVKVLGFEFSLKDGKTVEVTAIPIGIEADAVADMIVTIAGRLANGTGNAEISRDMVFEKALYQASCKAAIKAGRDEDIEHIKWIVKKLLSLDDIKVCPHGRPVAFELTKNAIEHQFKRG